MSDQSTAAEAPAPVASDRGGLSIGLFIIFAMMLWLAVVSVSYAVTMIGFLGDGGYFLSYGSLCGTVPTVASIDQFVPFFLAAMWGVAIYLGFAKSPRFYRYSFIATLVSIIYGAIDIVTGPFTFRVGPASFDPTSVTCGRWPRDITQLPDLSRAADRLAGPADQRLRSVDGPDRADDPRLSQDLAAGVAAVRTADRAQHLRAPRSNRKDRKDLARSRGRERSGAKPCAKRCSCGTRPCRPHA